MHVGIAAVLGYVFALPLTSWAGLEPRLGAAGLTLAASLAAWVELLLLRRSLMARIGPTGLAAGFRLTLFAAAGLSAAAGWAVKLALPPLHPVFIAILVLGAFGATFGAVTLAMRVPEASAVLARVTGRSAL